MHTHPSLRQVCTSAMEKYRANSSKHTWGGEGLRGATLLSSVQIPVGTIRIPRKDVKWKGIPR